MRVGDQLEMPSFVKKPVEITNVRKSISDKIYIFIAVNRDTHPNKMNCKAV